VPAALFAVSPPLVVLVLEELLPAALVPELASVLVVLPVVVVVVAVVASVALLLVVPALAPVLALAEAPFEESGFDGDRPSCVKAWNSASMKPMKPSAPPLTP